MAPLPPMGLAPAWTNALYIPSRAELAALALPLGLRLRAAAGWLQDAADRCTASSPSLPAGPQPAGPAALSPGMEAVLALRPLGPARGPPP